MTAWTGMHEQASLRSLNRRRHREEHERPAASPLQRVRRTSRCPRSSGRCSRRAARRAKGLYTVVEEGQNEPSVLVKTAKHTNALGILLPVHQRAKFFQPPQRGKIRKKYSRNASAECEVTKVGMSKLLQRVKGVYKEFYEYAICPKSIRANHRSLSVDNEVRLLELITQVYHKSNEGLSRQEMETTRDDLNAHLYGRLKLDRSCVVPWLASLRSLKDARILEIGCGTGASTVALAEQGARVVGVDINETSLGIARERCRLYGLDSVELHLANARNLVSLGIEKYDFIIFFACIEHMTLNEKLESISLTWERAKPGAHLVVLETPNRLWWNDSHTSFLPFYNWLPDDLALHYAKYSPRAPFNRQAGPPVDEEKLLWLTRFGRAASYHEFELAISSLAQHSVVCMNAWRRRRDPVRYAHWVMKGYRSYQSMLRSRLPELSDAFCGEYLNFAIRKLPERDGIAQVLS
jgi:2-polyprenyl-3-methyl-5-hydroxy-6-metoxy-1,4-benzoquinol methylase